MDIGSLISYTFISGDLGYIICIVDGLLIAFATQCVTCIKNLSGTGSNADC